MPKTYIIGHQKPDTDSVVAAMALEYLYSQVDCFGYTQPIAVITDWINPETAYLFEKYGVTAPPVITAEEIGPDDQVVLVDHNEAEQRLANLNPAQIVDIIDHHKANLNLPKPIYLTFKTWGSSATIVYDLMKQNNVQPEEKLAKMMLAAILSDTVGLKSATTTDSDKDLAIELAKLAKVTDLTAFSLEIFKAKSNISSLSNEEIVKNDYKIYEFDQKTFISQLETVQQRELLSQKRTVLLTAMEKVKADLGVDLLFVAVTDVLAVNTKLLLAGEAEAKIAQTAFGGQARDGILDIGGKMSRKKEIAPAIESAIKEK